MRGDGEHRHARAVAIEQAVDEVQVAWPAAAGADGELAGQMRFGTGREGRDLLVPDMDPLDLALAADGIRQPVQAVADEAVDAFHAGSGQDLDELFGQRLRHEAPPPMRIVRRGAGGPMRRGANYVAQHPAAGRCPISKARESGRANDWLSNQRSWRSPRVPERRYAFHGTTFSQSQFATIG